MPPKPSEINPPAKYSPLTMALLVACAAKLKKRKWQARLEESALVPKRTPNRSSKMPQNSVHQRMCAVHEFLRRGVGLDDNALRFFACDRRNLQAASRSFV